MADGAKAVAEVIAAAAKAMVARERVMIKVCRGNGNEIMRTLPMMEQGIFDVIEASWARKARACCCETCDVCVSVSAEAKKDLCQLLLT